MSKHEHNYSRRGIDNTGAYHKCECGELFYEVDITKPQKSEARICYVCQKLIPLTEKHEHFNYVKSEASDIRDFLEKWIVGYSKAKGNYKGMTEEFELFIRQREAEARIDELNKIPKPYNPIAAELHITERLEQLKAVLHKETK